MHGGKSYQKLALRQEAHLERQRECFQRCLGAVVPADMHLGKGVGFEVWDMALGCCLSVDFCWFKG